MNTPRRRPFGSAAGFKALFPPLKPTAPPQPVVPPAPPNQPTTPRGVTVRDIAAAAKVSIGTVSRALKDQRGLSDETRLHVREVAHQLGYDLTRLRSDKARRLIFLLNRQHSHFAVNPFFAEVLHGAEDACRAHGMAPTLVSVGPDDALKDLMRLHEPQVLVVAGYLEAASMTEVAALGLPFVLIDGSQPPNAAVNPDNEGGGFVATQHLLARDRRRIAFLAGALPHVSIRERGRGYRRALFEAGVLANPDLEVQAPVGMDEASGAAAAMQTLLQGRERPDAVFAYNDSAALAAMQVCLSAGLRVPEDIAFVGFDDIPAASYCPVPLTTLRVDRQALGRAAVDLLIGPGQPSQQLTLPVTLQVRRSSGN